MKQHVIEFNKTQALLGFQANAAAFRLDHPVDTEMPPDISQERNILKRYQPVGVVDHQCPAFGKIDEAGQLVFNPPGIFINLFSRQQPPHFGFAAGIPYHSGPAAHHGNGTVAVFLHVGKRHDRNQTSHMQAGGCRIETDIAATAGCIEEIFQFLPVGYGLDKPSFP